VDHARCKSAAIGSTRDRHDEEQHEMMINSGYLRSGVFGLPIDEARFSVRGFNRASPARARLEQVGTSVVAYYNLAAAEGCGENLAEYLGFVSNELCGFAHEGAAMGLFAIDSLAPFTRGNFDRFISGPAKNHVYMSFIGAGLAIGALRLSFEPALDKYAHFSKMLILDGYGFFHAFFKTDLVVRRRRMHAKVAGNPVYRERYDAGVGRALWFVEGGDPDRLAKTVEAFPAERHPQLWAGIGLACTYAGGVSADWIGQLLEVASGHELMLAQGALLACHARHRAGNPAGHNDHAARILTGLTSADLHAIAEVQLGEIDEYAATTNGKDTWTAWLDKVRASLSAAMAPAPWRLASVAAGR
jgi:hypothetical protein